MTSPSRAELIDTTRGALLTSYRTKLLVQRKSQAGVAKRNAEPDGSIRRKMRSTLCVQQRSKQQETISTYVTERLAVLARIPAEEPKSHQCSLKMCFNIAKLPKLRKKQSLLLTRRMQPCSTSNAQAPWTSVSELAPLHILAGIASQ